MAVAYELVVKADILSFFRGIYDDPKRSNTFFLREITYFEPLFPNIRTNLRTKYWIFCQMPIYCP